jgi:YVTN family beta-propeller protein
MYQSQGPHYSGLGCQTTEEHGAAALLRQHVAPCISGPDNWCALCQRCCCRNTLDERRQRDRLSGQLTYAVFGRRQLSPSARNRGCALTPNGALPYVANHTEGTVSIINTSSRTVVGTVFVGRNPTAIAVTNNRDESDLDERVFVTQIFAELIPNGPGEARDLGKEGVVHTFPVANPNNIAKITLSPLSNSGFTSNRTQFCPNLNPNIHPADRINPIFYPDPTATAANAAITSNSQGVFPNQLLSAVIRGDRLWLPNIGAQPEPVERFDANVQALVYAVDTASVAEVASEHVNLNAQIATEPVPTEPATLAHLFGKRYRRHRTAQSGKAGSPAHPRMDLSPTVGRADPSNSREPLSLRCESAHDQRQLNFPAGDN